MTVRFSGRHDGLLLGGIAIALLTVFDRTIAWFIAFASEVEAGYGVRLVPALVVLTGLVFVHQHLKRREAAAEAAAAAAAAAEAAERMRELERLHALGQKLAAALTLEAIQAVMWRYVPIVTEDREAWVSTLSAGKCDILFDTSGVDPLEIDQITVQLVESVESGPELPTFTRHGHWCCFPMVAGGNVIGVLGVADRNPAIGAQAARVLAAATAVLGIAIRNVQLFVELRDTAITDSLTGCLNRTHMIEVLGAELRRSRRTGSPLSLLMIDLDGFKLLNDSAGHVAGDAALAAIAKRFREVLRHSDVRCRYGGDEFLVLLPDTPMGGAAHVAETLRREIEQLQVGVDTRGTVITASIGVATTVPGEIDPVASIQRADSALYQAKRAGRNRVAVYDPAFHAAAAAAAPATALAATPVAAAAPAPVPAGPGPVLVKSA